jgi:uncharacterized protein YkwD
MMRRGLVVAMIVVVALVLPANASAGCGAAADRAPRASVSSLRAVGGATLCLLNAQRARYGLGPLHAYYGLAAAALSHAQDMVAKRYFSHDAPSGQSIAQRILAAGFVPTDAAALGENLAWGGGAWSTPRRIVRGWMASAGHRRNILDPAFRAIGIGVVAGAPGPRMRGGATYVADFATGGR